MSILMSVLYPVLAIGGMGVLFGLGLGYAGEIFKVPVDENAERIREALPGANCGGCGFAGCDAFAAAVAGGEAKANGCPVGGQEASNKIAEVLGVKAEAFIRKTAFVKCRGTDDTAESRYNYYGMADCAAEMVLADGGSKSCKYGCLGDGSCVSACTFGAISLKDGIAIVDSEKCTQCGACVRACPRNIIELIPYDSKVRVKCNSRDSGKVVRAICSVGCISCKMCERACGYNAVSVRDNIAKVDYQKCTQCGDCAAKCPVKVIV